MDKGCKGGSCALNSGICVSLSVEEWGERSRKRWGGGWSKADGEPHSWEAGRMGRDIRCLLWVRAMLPTVAVPAMHAWKAEVVVQVPQWVH